MKVVEAFPNDVDVRRAGLALVVGIAEHGGGLPRTSNEKQYENNEDSLSVVESDAGNLHISAEAAAAANRLGTVGAVALVAAWLRETTAPAWAWGDVGYEFGIIVSDREKARDLLMACKAATLLCRNSTVNQDQLTSMGACDALTRAVAVSGKYIGAEDAAGDVIIAAKEVGSSRAEIEDNVRSLRMEGQVWAARGIAEVAAGHTNQNRCLQLVKAGALRALFAAMSNRPSKRQLQRAGCLALASVALASRNPTYLHSLGRNGGAKAVIIALAACAGDENVAKAGLLATAKLAVSSENRRLLGEVGACPLIASVVAEFAENPDIAEQGCCAVAGLAALSGFNRTALGCAGAVEAMATVLRNHPANTGVQRWGLAAAAALVADTDPSGNSTRIKDAGVLALVARALARFPHNPSVQVEGLRAFAKIATAGAEGEEAAWEAGALVPTTRALGLYLYDGDVQHWGMATMRTMTGSEEKCEAWRGAGAPEAVVRTLVAFGEEGVGRRLRHDESGCGRASEARACTPEEAFGIQFQACACALHLAGSPDGRRRLVHEGAGAALASMMVRNPRNAAAQRGALAALAAMSASGADNRRRLHRSKGGVPAAIVSALSNFPNDRRVRCEGALTIQNLSFAVGGARAMTKAGVAQVAVWLLRNVLDANAGTGTTAQKPTSGRHGVFEHEHLDRDGEGVDFGSAIDDTLLTPPGRRRSPRKATYVPLHVPPTHRCTTDAAVFIVGFKLHYWLLASRIAYTSTSRCFADASPKRNSTLEITILTPVPAIFSRTRSTRLRYQRIVQHGDRGQVNKQARHVRSCYIGPGMSPERPTIAGRRL